MHSPSRRPLPKPAPRADRSRQVAIGAAAVAVLIALAWLVWPSKYANVANLDSRGTTIVAFGDSLTAGVGATPDENYVARLSSALGETIVNAGVSGDTSSAALARIDRDVLPNDPRIVIVGLGGNDFLQHVPIAHTEENLRAIVDRIQEAGAMVVLLGFRFPSLNANYEAMYERVAEDEQCLLVPDVLDGILSKPELRSDAIHPNANGYAILADRVSAPVAKLIRASEEAR